MGPTALTVLGVVSDKNSITLFLDTGEELMLSNTEYRTRDILDQVLPVVSNSKQARIFLKDYKLHTDFEESTGGAVRFFRVAKSLVSSVFGGKAAQQPTESPQETPVTKAGNTVLRLENPAPAPSQSVSAGTPAPTLSKQIERVGTKDTDLPADMLQDTTIVALVGNKVIPNMEALRPQIAYAIRKNNAEGVTYFLERVASVIDQRGHSIEDLLNFMKLLDLPITKDGSIIAYKVVNKNKNEEYPQFRFADCHSGLVCQDVGTRVFMDRNLVDPDRNNDCSNGLHVASKGYFQSFSGQDLLIIKIAPEDFIAVPRYDQKKARVSGYHVVWHVSPEVKQRVISSGSMTQDDDIMKGVLSDIINGNHVDVLQSVKITGPRGTGLIVTDHQLEKSRMKLKAMMEPETPTTDEELIKKSQPHESISNSDLSTSGETVFVDPITPKQVREAAKKAKTNKTTTSLTPDQEKAKRLLNEGKLSKAEIARQCGTSTRSLGRWIEKFGW